MSHKFCKCSLDFSEICMTDFIMTNWKDCTKIGVSASTLPRQTLFVFFVSHCYCLPHSLLFHHLYNELQNYLSFVLGIHLGTKFLSGCVNRINAQQYKRVESRNRINNLIYFHQTTSE